MSGNARTVIPQMSKDGFEDVGRVASGLYLMKAAEGQRRGAS